MLDINRSCLPRIAASVLLLAACRAGAGQASGGYVNFSLDSVDVSAFIKLVGEVTGRQFVVGEDMYDGLAKHPADPGFSRKGAVREQRRSGNEL